jgi:hypothetical protein
MDDNTKVPKFKYLGIIFTEEGKNKEDIIQQVKEAKVMFSNKKQLLCMNNLSLEIEKMLTQIYIWSVALYGSDTWTLGKNEEKVINALEAWCWKRMLKIKWADRIMYDEVFLKGERRNISFKNF